MYHCLIKLKYLSKLEVLNLMFNSLMGSVPLIMCEKEILPNKK